MHPKVGAEPARSGPGTPLPGVQGGAVTRSLCDGTSAVAVQGYGAFAPWRSPLLLPSVLLVALGVAGLGVEVVVRRREMH